MTKLFSVNKNGTVIICKEAMLLVPEFSYLSEKEMLAIILAIDHYSVLRQWVPDISRSRARSQVFGTEREKFFQEAKIKKAVEAYKALQYDPRRNSVLTYRKTLADLDTAMSTLGKDDGGEITKIVKAQMELRKAIEQLEKEMSIEEEEGLQEDENNTKLSFLEKLKDNVDRYKMVTSKKN